MQRRYFLDRAPSGRRRRHGAAGAFDVQYGRSVDQTIKLALGHVSLEVLDANGQAVQGMYAQANISG
jgi:hypothetical protein